MRLLKVKHSYRHKPQHCGPWTLKIAFSFLGKDIPFESIMRLFPRYVPKHGLEHKEMIKAAQTLGAKVITKQDATLKDLEHWLYRKHTPVIVGWFSEDDDHYSVVVGLDRKYVYMSDSQYKKPVTKISRKLFPYIWFDFLGKNDTGLCWGWMMVIEPRR